MQVIYTIVLVILILLAASSGIAKILMLEQDVNFFGRYGFSAAMLVAFGFTQLLGGALMIFTKTRFAGAAVVAMTFLVSLVILLLDGNIPVSIVTGIATLLLGLVMKRSWQSAPQ